MKRKLAALGICVVALCSGAGEAASTGGARAAFHPELWPQAARRRLDPRTERFVNQLLAQLTLEEKVGQMIQADIASITPADLKTYRLGSILAGGNAAPGDNIRSDAKAWLDLTDSFFRASLTPASPAQPNAHRPIPILFGIDAVHGNAKLVGATVFPHNVGLGAAHDPALIQQIGEATAQEVSALGIDWAFAPTVAVARDVRWGRSYESYSESPLLVSQYASAMVTGLQGQAGAATFMAPGHALSSVKHFLGDGGTTDGRDQGNTEISETELSAVHGAGYPAAIGAGALIVMASYNSWNGTKLHADHYLLEDVLKGRLGFAGFVVGDWNAHEQIPGCTKYSCAAAILAGVDMLMAPDGWKQLYDNTLAQVRAGEIPMSRIDAAVRRILRVKAIAKLFDREVPGDRAAAGRFEVIGSAAHRTLAREAVRKSLVLLKNDRALLPLDPHSRVLVTGAAADDVGVQAGGWTIDWQGNHNTRADFPGATSIYEGIQAAVKAGGGSVTLSRDGHTDSKPDVAIVVFGEGPYAEFQGDRETLEFSPGDKQDLALLRSLQRQGIPTVSVFLSGRPLWVNPELNASTAFVAAWLPGSEGGGIADMLFRKPDARVAFDFVGRLSFSWPLTAMPVTFAPDGTVEGALYPRDFGLSYAKPDRTTRTAGVPLPEDPGVTPRYRSPPGTLFDRAHPVAPWSLFVADGLDEVHVTTSWQASPRNAVSMSVGTQHAVASWTGTREGMVRFVGRAQDLRARAAQGAAVELRYRVDHTPQGVVHGVIRCTDPACGVSGGAMVDLTALFKSSPVGVWKTAAFPLACFGAAGARLDTVEVPFALSTVGRFVLSIDHVRLVDGAAGAPCPGAALAAVTAAASPAAGVGANAR